MRRVINESSRHFPTKCEYLRLDRRLNGSSEIHFHSNLGIDNASMFRMSFFIAREWNVRKAIGRNASEQAIIALASAIGRLNGEDRPTSGEDEAIMQSTNRNNKN